MARVEHIEAGTSITHCSGTADRSPKCKKCGSWINHWEKYRKNSLKRCCLCIDGKKEVGAHVKIDGYKGEWIIPTCKSCNSEGGYDIIIHKVDAVSAVQCEE